MTLDMRLLGTQQPPAERGQVLLQKSCVAGSADMQPPTEMLQLYVTWYIVLQKNVMLRCCVAIVFFVFV